MGKLRGLEIMLHRECLVEIIWTKGFREFLLVVVLLRWNQEWLIKLFNEWKLILEYSLLILLNPLFLLFSFSLFCECLSESASIIIFASSPYVLFKQHLLHVLAHNFLLKIEIRLMFILYESSAFLDLPQLSLLYLLQMRLLEVLIMIFTTVGDSVASAFLDGRMDWLKETAGWGFFEQIVISAGRGQTGVHWKTIISGHIHIGNLLFGGGKTQDFINDSFWVLIKHTLSLIRFPGLAKARDECVFVHLRGLRRLYRGADVNFEQGLFRRYPGVKFILRVCL